MSKDLTDLKNQATSNNTNYPTTYSGGGNSPALPTFNNGAPGGSLISAAAEVEAQRAIAEVQASMAIAKRFPRNKIQVTEEILRDCCRYSLAEVAVYQYARGGTDITGPSIRLAEVIAQNWGNIVFGWKEISRSNGASEIEAYAWDLEKNLKRPIQFQVKHWRDTKKGGYALTDERDIYELCANQAARRLRSCILSIIPGDVVEAAKSQCEATLKDKTQITPERITKMLEAFEAYEVTKEQIEKRIQRRLDKDIPGALFVSLTRIYNSLKDGLSKSIDWFEPIEKEPKEKSEKAAAKSTEKKSDLPDDGKVPFEPQTWTLESASAFISKSQNLKTIISVKRITPDEALAIITKHDGDLRKIVEEIDGMKQNPAPETKTKETKPKADF